MSVMFGWRATGVLGFSVALAGGLAYALWNYVFLSRQSRESRHGDDGASGRGEPRPAGEKLKEEGAEEGAEDAEESVVVARVETVCSAQRAQKVSERSMSVKPEGTQVLVLGLDGAGKSSLLHCLAIGSLDVDMVPTQGFNAVSINREGLHVEFLEIGGKAELRPYWPRYMSKALLLVFVVDSSAPQLFAVAKWQLHELLHSNPDLPLMVLANKQDLPGACSITDLHDALELSKVGDRKLFLIGTCVNKGERELGSGVRDARELIIQLTGGK